MDIYEIRMKNYRVLYEQHKASEMRQGAPARGALTRFAEFCELSPAYLSHVNNDRKNIGAEVARKIETACALPHGWMDVDHVAGIDPENAFERQFTALALRMYRDAPEDRRVAMLQSLTQKFLSQEAQREMQYEPA